MTINGILARDNTGWQDDFAAAVKENGFGVMWKDQFSYLDEVLPELASLISEKGFFEYYNVANNVTNYRMEIVDFATADNYNDKKKEWKQKDPAWFFDSFDNYSDGKQKAIIAFLVKNVEKIQPQNSISIDDFKTYKDKKASVKNAVAYTKIITVKEINMKVMVDTLIHNHNLILTGAPGTGKTYMAKQIAQLMIFGQIKDDMNDDEKKQFNEQCGFVQFHPSYDYTDLVEGLRPVHNDNDNVGFERKDGVFKEFCKKAILSQKTSSIDNFDTAWNLLVDYLNVNDFIDVPFISNSKKSFRVELNEYGTGLANRTYEDDAYQKGEWIKGQSKFFNKEQLYNIYRGFPGIPSGGHDNYRRAIVEKMKTEFGLKEYQKGETLSTDCEPFVFIIDEINRGELSKIFGELFFAIDPGYRGEKGRVKTQYQNLVEPGDPFEKGFFVPDNVYIIGTMNDIDRGVESMDFAVRRRFAWLEVKVEDRVSMLDEKIPDWSDAAKRCMNSINDALKEKTIGLTSAYDIGPAYFLKLELYDGDFEKLWDYHIKGVVTEYLRGTRDVEEKVAALKEAFNAYKD